MTLETTLEIVLAIALPLWLLVEQFLKWQQTRALSQPSGGSVENGRVRGATNESLRVNNSTGPALRRWAA